MSRRKVTATVATDAITPVVTTTTEAARTIVTRAVLIKSGTDHLRKVLKAEIDKGKRHFRIPDLYTESACNMIEEEFPNYKLREHAGGGRGWYTYANYIELPKPVVGGDPPTKKDLPTQSHSFTDRFVVTLIIILGMTLVLLILAALISSPSVPL